MNSEMFERIIYLVIASQFALHLAFIVAIAFIARSKGAAIPPNGGERKPLEPVKRMEFGGKTFQEPVAQFRKGEQS